MGKLRLLWMLVLSVCLYSCSSDEDTLDQVNQGSGFLTKGVYPLENMGDLDLLMNEIGNSQYVLIGEASHGTSEFYTWRANLSKRLIQEKGFTLIAVEGDWPAAYSLNQYIQGQGSGTGQQAVASFQRWPTWMWANQEVATFSDWLREHNQTLTQNQKVGFYGMDVYSLWESLDEIRTYMETADPAIAQLTRDAQTCLAPYNRDEQLYAQATAQGASCSGQLQKLLEAVQAFKARQPANDEAAFNAEQNALVAVNAERYYFQMVRSGTGSWNVRDRHMQETVNRLVAHKGNGAKIIIWAHNTHVGDARYTDMANSGMVNIGQLLREEHAQQGVYLVGFGSYQGQVVASNMWGGATRVMNVPAAMNNSWEDILHRHSPGNKLLLMRELRDIPEAMQRRGHRAIGVEYNPVSEAGNYVPTVLPQRYDAFLFIDQTTALNPL
ncbi:erythromycin esterase family protein [Rufibacter latericius]|uniref:Erythromycin esterase family protein n=1 Tax=Rufibacter latericius TaxID=2487040 RepID=A0A3M9MTG2_9BACT|nr:erythromycin esterase family protein [Rufibacter latericius]RNI28779.1 erythromycin esterase family protein [Rufibacter latericius]